MIVAASSDPQHPDMELLPITARSSDTGWLNTVDTNGSPSGATTREHDMNDDRQLLVQALSS